MEAFVAGSEHVEDLAVLFDQYRVFYKQSSDIAGARRFLEERFQKNDSVVLIAINNSEVVGFTQLYPSFSSVSMNRIWILNDLFVKESYRRKGVAKLLMKAVENHAQQTKAVRVVLSTQVSNISAQALYESLEYVKDKEFYHYALQLR